MKYGVALIAILSGAAASAEPMTTAEVLARVREGTGRAAFLEKAAAGVQLRGKTTFLGMEETCTLTMTPAGSYVLEQSGPIPTTRALGSKGPWRMDIGGETAMLSLGEAESARLFGAACTGRWLDEGSGLELAVEDARTTESRVHLSFRLKNGLTSGDISIDRATWRPAEWTMRAGAKTETLTFNGEHRVEGAWLPREVIQYGQDGDASTSTFETAGPSPQFFRSPYEPATLKAADVSFDAAAPAVLESRRAKTGHALVKVLVDGKPGWFIFDTGAGTTVIDKAFAASLELKTFGAVQAVGVGGAVTTGFVRPKMLRAGRATQRDALLAELDLSAIAKAMGEKIDGVLGYNIMHRTIARLSTGDGAVSLHDPATFDDRGLTWFPLIVYDRHACVAGTFEGHEGVFTLDTGAGTQPVTMHFPAVERFKMLEGRTVTDSRAGGVGGQVRTKAGRLEWLEVGGRREENVPAAFAVEEKGVFGNPFTVGHLSLKQLGPRDVVFDYAGGRIAFPDRAPTPSGK